LPRSGRGRTRSARSFTPERRGGLTYGSGGWRRQTDRPATPRRSTHRLSAAAARPRRRGERAPRRRLLPVRRPRGASRRGGGAARVARVRAAGSREIACTARFASGRSSVRTRYAPYTCARGKRVRDRHRVLDAFRSRFEFRKRSVSRGAARSSRMPRRIARSISPTIDVSCSPRPCQLRHRGDVEQGPASAPNLLMTWFAMLEDADTAGGRR
jgi:hypothetical protein